MVGVGRVAAIFGFPPRHVTGDAVTGWRRVGVRQCVGVAREAPSPEIRNWVGGYGVWVVAGSTPHPAVARQRAPAAGELLGLAHNLEGVRALGPRRRNVRREHIFETQPGVEIGRCFSWVVYSHYTRQVALFADAIAQCRGELSRIHD